MRLLTLDECADVTTKLFDRFVCPLAVSQMTGEVPSIHFGIHRRGTKDKDWLAQVKYKHTMSISVFQCDLWLEDVFRLCRRCRIWLITREVFQIVCLYAMLHPIYQTECMDFHRDMDSDYESMMIGAGKLTHEFIRSYYPITDDVQPIVLEILRYHMMEFTNHWYGLSDGSYRETYRDLQRRYEQEMLAVYEGPYKVARSRKANTSLLDYEGFLRLERITEGSVKYEDQGIKDSTLADNVRREEGFNVPEETERPYGYWSLGTNEERGFTSKDLTMASRQELDDSELDETAIMDALTEAMLEGGGMENVQSEYQLLPKRNDE